jgi:hypothetical protein
VQRVISLITVNCERTRRRLFSRLVDMYLFSLLDRCRSRKHCRERTRQMCPTMFFFAKFHRRTAVRCYRLEQISANVLNNCQKLHNASVPMLRILSLSNKTSSVTCPSLAVDLNCLVQSSFEALRELVLVDKQSDELICIGYCRSSSSRTFRLLFHRSISFDSDMSYVVHEFVRLARSCLQWISNGIDELL